MGQYKRHKSSVRLRLKILLNAKAAIETLQSAVNHLAELISRCIVMTKCGFNLQH